MPRQRPTIILVIAILHFIFGGIGLFCGICSGVMELAGPSRILQANPQQGHRQQVTEQVLSRKVPLYRAYSIGNRISSLLSCLLLIASGVGLLYVQSWGRWLSVVYALLSLFVNLIVLVYTIVFFMPAYEEIFRQLPPQSDQEEIAYTFAKVAGPAGGCIMMIYPMVVLIVMLLPSIAATFQARNDRQRSLSFED